MKKAPKPVIRWAVYRNGELVFVCHGNAREPSVAYLLSNCGISSADDLIRVELRPLPTKKRKAARRKA